jgi:NADPH:quinone reductase-like Zn-dependent oxidoreductase
MKAAVYTTYGSPDVVALRDVEKPVPRENQVLIRVHATTVNRTDSAALRGRPLFARALLYGLRRPRNIILGNEFAGEVESAGNAVTGFQPGDRVFGYNDATYGGHAEYVTMREDGMLAHIPADLTYEDAAPTAEGAHYALKDIRKANVQPGQNVLVIGASGAIGSASVQLLKHFGANVTAVCGTRNVELVRSLGADRVIDYTQDDFARTGETYDFIHDAVGKSSFGVCRKLLKPGGIYCPSELGRMAQNPFLALWTSRFGSRKVIFPIPRSSKDDMIFLKGLVESGAFKPVIDRRYPLDEIAEAFRYVETGRKTGNVIITV